MNRRMIVFAIAGVALAAFAGAAYFFNRGGSVEPAAPIVAPAVVQSDAPAVAPVEPQVPAAETARAADTPAPAPARWNTYVRRHSPVMGPANARVTIVEFFDPSCEACRAFYPVVKQIMAQYPNDVRLVLRYTPFHQGSEEAVRILETARRQNLFEPVLEALFAQQPQWANDRAPQTELAWEAAASAGLDVARARTEMMSPNITAVVNQDVADVSALNIRGTPTFFVNEKPLPSFGAQQLYDLVRAEVEALD